MRNIGIGNGLMVIVGLLMLTLPVFADVGGSCYCFNKYSAPYGSQCDCTSPNGSCTYYTATKSCGDTALCGTTCAVIDYSEVQCKRRVGDLYTYQWVINDCGAQNCTKTVCKGGDVFSC